MGFLRNISVVILVASALVGCRKSTPLSPESENEKTPIVFSDGTKAFTPIMSVSRFDVCGLYRTNKPVQQFIDTYPFDGMQFWTNSPASDNKMKFVGVWPTGRSCIGSYDDYSVTQAFSFDMTGTEDYLFFTTDYLSKTTPVNIQFRHLLNRIANVSFRSANSASFTVHSATMLDYVSSTKIGFYSDNSNLTSFFKWDQQYTNKDITGGDFSFFPGTYTFRVDYSITLGSRTERYVKTVDIDLGDFGNSAQSDRYGRIYNIRFTLNDDFITVSTVNAEWGVDWQNGGLVSDDFYVEETEPASNEIWITPYEEDFIYDLNLFCNSDIWEWSSSNEFYPESVREENGKFIFSFTDTIVELPRFFISGEAIGSIVFPSTVRQANSNTFDSCEIKYLSFPSGWTDYSHLSFDYSNIDEIVFPETTERIGSSLFCDVYINTITCKATIPPVFDDPNDVFAFGSFNTIYVPEESTYEYRNAEGWSEKRFIIFADNR